MRIRVLNGMLSSMPREAPINPSRLMPMSIPQRQHLQAVAAHQLRAVIHCIDCSVVVMHQ